MGYFLGVDGGGTKTNCLLCNEEGQIMGRGYAGPSNYHVVGVARAAEALQQCIASALLSAGNPSIEVCYLGLAGVDRPDDKEVIEKIVRGLNLPLKDLVMDNDAAVAWAGATETQPGVTVVSGTGSIIFGINRQGQRARAGGWGPILGDEGGGYDLGRLAMVAALRDEDGRGKATLLKGLIMDTLRLERITELVSKVYVNNMERHEIAALSHLVFAAAKQGDLVAQELVTYAGLELSLGVRAVVKKLGLESTVFAIALAGGVFVGGQALQPIVTKEVKTFAPQAVFISPSFGPDVGAVLLALQHKGIALTPNVLHNLRRKGL